MKNRYLLNFTKIFESAMFFDRFVYSFASSTLDANHSGEGAARFDSTELGRENLCENAQRT